jgi:hypothetical protein
VGKVKALDAGIALSQDKEVEAPIPRQKAPAAVDLVDEVFGYAQPGGIIPRYFNGQGLIWGGCRFHDPLYALSVTDVSRNIFATHIFFVDIGVS